jgi:hypothetical protein
MPMAKLASWLLSNSSRCGGVITLSTRSLLPCGVRDSLTTGLIRPFIFMDGGIPAVTNKSEAFSCAINFRNEAISMPLIKIPPHMKLQYDPQGLHENYNKNKWPSRKATTGRTPCEPAIITITQKSFYHEQNHAPHCALSSCAATVPADSDPRSACHSFGLSVWMNKAVQPCLHE